MKPQLIPTLTAVVLIGLLGACKKAEQTTVGDAKNGVLLQVKWPVGNRYVYRMDLDQHSTNKIPQLPKPVEQDTTMAMTYALSVVKETANGGREVELEFVANAMEVRMANQFAMTYDSKDTNDEADTPMMAPFRRMIGSKVRLLVNADGKVNDVSGVDDWRARVALDEAGPAGQMMSQQFNPAFFRLLADFGRGLSTNRVAVGQTWPFKIEVPSGPTGKIAVDAKITLTGWEKREQHQCAILESTGTLKGVGAGEAGPMGKMKLDNGKVSGKTWFDPELGAMIDSVSDQTIRVKGDLPGPPGGNKGAGFTSDINQKITIKLVELGKTKS